MNYLIGVIFSFSISIASIEGAWRFRVIHPAFRPFIYCLWLALLNELVSQLMITMIHSNAVNSNIYVLLEALLFVWQFYKWGLFGNNKIIFPALLVLLLMIWTTENFFLFSIRQFTSYFRVFYSFVVVLLSISLLNRQIVRGKGLLLKNPVVLICLTFILYYTYKVLVETFWVYGLNESAIFQTKVYRILGYINLFSNLIYALAVLWMPTKHRFTLPY